MRKLLIGVLVISSCAMQIVAQEKSDEFDFLLALTRQDIELDWWSAVPSQFGPELSTISSISKREYFKILPIFNNYGTTSNGTVNITYDVVIQRPDGSIYEQIENSIGYQGKSTSPNLIPSVNILVVCFEPEDPFGEYVIKVSAIDHVKDHKIQKSERISLQPFELPDLANDENDMLFFNYPTRPQPSKALAEFLQHPHSYLDKEGEPVWSALWFYKKVFDDNSFLIPHTVRFFKEKATKQQKKNILFLFHLINKIDVLPVDNGISKQYIAKLATLNLPDPYSEISTGNQLDMLWAEFFATSRVKPVRQILTALNLSKYVGTLEKIKAGEIDIQSSEEVRRKAILDAVFQSALWSIRSNCEQSQLLFRYCVGLYESDQLNKTEKSILGMILQEVFEDERKKSN